MAAEDFQLRRFTRLDGGTVRLYCRRCRSRVTLVFTYNLYEDYRGRRWLEIAAGQRSHLEELHDDSFAERVAADLLALGLNKYSG